MIMSKRILFLIVLISIVFIGVTGLQALELNYNRIFYEIDEDFNIVLALGLNGQEMAYQEGGHNFSLIYQEDKDNYYRIKQEGENNRAVIIQQGSGNTAVINQSTSNNEEAD